MKEFIMSNYVNRNGGFKGKGQKSNNSNDKANNKPAYSLAVRLPGEEGITPITGLFHSISTKGDDYGSVSTKEDIVIPAGSKLMFFFNKK